MVVMLRITMAMLKRADVCTPKHSTKVQLRISTPDSGEMFSSEFTSMPTSHFGTFTPHVANICATPSENPLATALAEIAYSRVRLDPMNHATASPRLTYAKVYADPLTGMRDANSAYAKAEMSAAKDAMMKHSTMAGPATLAATCPVTT